MHLARVEVAVKAVGKHTIAGLRPRLAPTGYYLSVDATQDYGDRWVQRSGCWELCSARARLMCNCCECPPLQPAAPAAPCLVQRPRPARLPLPPPRLALTRSLCLDNLFEKKWDLASNKYAPALLKLKKLPLDEAAPQTPATRTRQVRARQKRGGVARRPARACRSHQGNAGCGA